MRFSGPRMLFRHPALALLHLLDGLNTRAISRKEWDRRTPSVP
jgi:hypothetical protein